MQIQTARRIALVSNGPIQLKSQLMLLLLTLGCYALRLFPTIELLTDECIIFNYVQLKFSR